MSLTQVINYDVPGNFVYNPDKIEVQPVSGMTPGRALLKLEPKTGQVFSQNFASSSGFTYDGSKTQIAANELSQVNQIPTGYTFYASLDSVLSGNWGSGDLSGNFIGTEPAPVPGHFDNGVEITGISGFGYQADQKFNGPRATWSFWMNPNWSGAPAGARHFITHFNGANMFDIANRIMVWQDSGGNIIVQVNDSAGNPALNSAGGVWSPVAGTWYNFELDFDFDEGFITLFIDGIQFCTFNIAPILTSGDGYAIIFGQNNALDQVADQSYDEIFFVSFAIHDSNFTPNISPLPAFAFLSDVITFPTFSYAGIGHVVEWMNFLSTTPGGKIAPQFVLNGLYWNGSAWVTSNLSFAQSNSVATIVANLSTLPLADSLVVKAITNNLNSSSMTSTLVEMDYSGQTYPIDNPAIEPNTDLLTNDLTDFSDSIVVSGADSVKFQLKINDILKWFNGTGWVTSDGTYAESNTGAEVKANISTAVNIGSTIVLVALLHSADGMTTPAILSASISYNYFPPPTPPPSTGIVFCRLRDILNENVITAELIAEPIKPFAIGEYVITIGQERVDFDSTGYAELQLVSSNVAEVPYRFQIDYTDIEGNEKNVQFVPVIVGEGIYSLAALTPVSNFAGIG